LQTISHQTIKLGRGRHTSPEHGACVMELASMLAGEPFSDHPQSVSPVIASFLRSLNDRLDDERRQDLYKYAAASVGTADEPDVERARADRLLAWGDEWWDRRGRQSIVERIRRHGARQPRRPAPDAAARYAIEALGRRVSDASHCSALRLVDELIAMPISGDAMAEPGARDRGGSSLLHASG
jgi:hypothetical protein